MNTSQKRRLWFMLAGMGLITLIIIYRLASFQIVQDDELAQIGRNIHNQQVIAQPERGVIYDRNMAVLAGNSSDYQIGVSPALITEAEAMATALSPILLEPRHEILQTLQSERPFELLAGRVSPDVAQAIRDLPYGGIQIDPLPRRVYPQGELLCHTIGYADFSSVGGSGLEGYYQGELAGEAASATVNISPLTAQQSVIAREGADLVLTIDRSVQFIVEQHLKKAMADYGSQSGTIIVMDPRTGAILAMASLPCFNPGKFFEADENLFLNPAVSQQYEPGSVMKLVTMAAALDSGTVVPQTTYYDAGVFEIGGSPIYNWDRGAYGTVDMTTLLANSLNVGSATIATWMGADNFYSYLQRFGFGRPTGIDLMAEAAGQMPLPGDSDWTESNLGTNAFGQGLATTPLQMISAISALANDGYLMQPYLVQEIHSQGQVFTHEPTILSRPVSEQTAGQVIAMSINAIRVGLPDTLIDGYTIGGKTGTAQIPEGGIYHPDDTIASFIGWLPADEPEMIILVKLDRPTVSAWGSFTAAPAFAELAQELVALLGIPPDNIRLQGDVMAIR